MPKKKASKSKKPTSIKQKVVGPIKSFYNTKTWLKIFLTLLVFWGLVWCGQVAVERYRFYDAEKKLDKLAAELQKELGDEYRLEKMNYCEYGSGKYERGNRVCTVSFSIGPTKASLDRANNLADSFKKAVGSDSNFPEKTSLGDSPFAEKDSSKGAISQSVGFSLTKKEASLKCGGELSYTIVPESTKQQGAYGDDYLEVSISCFKRTNVEYFPVKD